MTKKHLGDPQIKHLRTIHLFEADYNLTLKLLWGKWLVHQGEDNNCFGMQQHGSMPQGQAVNAVYMKTLTYHLIQILRLSLVISDNDATGCFDQIFVWLAMIAALQLSMPRSTARMHSSALLHMKYFVKTAHGFSKEFYHVVRDYLLYGTDQGSRASPLVWLLIVMCLLTALIVLAPIAVMFIDPLVGGIFETQNADSFVDNTSNGCNDAHLDSAMPYRELIAYGQGCAQIWE
jgi:hypothetical protein